SRTSGLSLARLADFLRPGFRRIELSQSLQCPRNFSPDAEQLLPIWDLRVLDLGGHHWLQVGWAQGPRSRGHNLFSFPTNPWHGRILQSSRVLRKMTEIGMCLLWRGWVAMGGILTREMMALGLKMECPEDEASGGTAIRAERGKEP
ncbi:hypothetical protein GOODEAATRI_015593, partial [Goodea atripinnis]